MYVNHSWSRIRKYTPCALSTEWLWVDSNGTDGKPTFHRHANLSSLSKICNHLREIATWSQKSLTIVTYRLMFLEKRPLMGKFSQTCSERIHHVSEPRLVCKFREIWLTGNRQFVRCLPDRIKTKFPQGLRLPLSLLRRSRPKSVRASSKQHTRSSENFILRNSNQHITLLWL